MKYLLCMTATLLVSGMHKPSDVPDGRPRSLSENDVVIYVHQEQVHLPPGLLPFAQQFVAIQQPAHQQHIVLPQQPAPAQQPAVVPPIVHNQHKPRQQCLNIHCTPRKIAAITALITTIGGTIGTLIGLLVQARQ